jgi:hypothetical protein
MNQVKFLVESAMLSYELKRQSWPQFSASKKCQRLCNLELMTLKREKLNLHESTMWLQQLLVLLNIKLTLVFRSTSANSLSSCPMQMRFLQRGCELQNQCTLPRWHLLKLKFRGGLLQLKRKNVNLQAKPVKLSLTLSDDEMRFFQRRKRFEPPSLKSENNSSNLFNQN